MFEVLTVIAAWLGLIGAIAGLLLQRHSDYWSFGRKRLRLERNRFGGDDLIFEPNRIGDTFNVRFNIKTEGVTANGVPRLAGKDRPREYRMVQRGDGSLFADFHFSGDEGVSFARLQFEIVDPVTRRVVRRTRRTIDL